MVWACVSSSSLFGNFSSKFSFMLRVLRYFRVRVQLMLLVRFSDVVYCVTLRSSTVYLKKRI